MRMKRKIVFFDRKSFLKVLCEKNPKWLPNIINQIVRDYRQTTKSKLSAGTCSALPEGMHTGFVFTVNLSDSKLFN